jgi:hypothetical protein
MGATNISIIGAWLDNMAMCVALHDYTSNRKVRILGMHRHIQGGLRRSLDARQLSDHLHIKEIKKA